MNLARLVYVSDVARPMSGAEVEELVAHSDSNNKGTDVTGLLVCAGGHFLQLLEGDSGRISNLFARISRDPRHTEVQCLLHKQSRDRLFPEWGMQLAGLHRMRPVDRERITKTLKRLRLAKFEEPATEAITLLKEIRDQMNGKPVPRLPLAS